jgi:hypothetical protein
MKTKIIFVLLTVCGLLFVLLFISVFMLPSASSRVMNNELRTVTPDLAHIKESKYISGSCYDTCSFINGEIGFSPVNSTEYTKLFELFKSQLVRAGYIIDPEEDAIKFADPNARGYFLLITANNPNGFYVRIEFEGDNSTWSGRANKEDNQNPRYLDSAKVYISASKRVLPKL